MFFCNRATQETKRAESLKTVVLTESLHFKSLYKWLFTTLRAPSTLFLHFRQPYLDVPGSRVTTKESRGNLTLPVIPESMHGMLFSPGIYSQERDAGRQSLAIKGGGISPGFCKAAQLSHPWLVPFFLAAGMAKTGTVIAWAHTF